MRDLLPFQIETGQTLRAEGAVSGGAAKIGKRGESPAAESAPYSAGMTKRYEVRLYLTLAEKQALMDRGYSDARTLTDAGRDAMMLGLVVQDWAERGHDVVMRAPDGGETVLAVRGLR